MTTKTVLTLGLLCSFALTKLNSAPIISPGSLWRYWDQGSEPANWKLPGFVEQPGQEWKEGPGELGYGDGDEATLVSYGPSSTTKFITTYFRKTFTLPNPQDFSALALKVWRDDGVVVYLNGTEVGRANMPSGQPGYSTLATSAIEETVDTFTLLPGQFIAGQNVFAVEVHQANGSSTDISFDLELAGASQVVRGPYLQMGTANSVVVRWRTVSATQSVVRYGTDPNPATWTSAQNLAAITEHEVQLTSLLPNTRYYYSVGNTAGTLATGSDYIFYTAPQTGASDPLRIWVLGDSGTADANAAAVRNAYYNFAATRYTDLLLMLGDNAYETGTDANYQAAVFNMYPEILRQTVLWPTIGNHDTAGSTSVGSSLPYFQMFTLPTAAQAGGVPSGTEKYYSFNYGTVHFVCLDSMTSSRSPGSAMLLWLESDLSATTLPWVIAFWHHPPYTKGSHDSDNTSGDYQLVEMRQNVLPILENYNVDLVLGGHSHAYERSFLIKNHYGLSTTFTSAMKVDGGSGRDNGTGSYNKELGTPSADEGSVYVVAGSSGKISGGTLNHPAMFLSLNQLGSLVMDVDGNKLDIKFLRENGAIADYFSIVKNNQRPTITISEPQNGSTQSGPGVTVNASANDIEGSVIEVVFYGDGTPIKTNTAAPFTFTWANVASGQHTLLARARDNKGATAFSPTVSFTVGAPPPQTPAAPGSLAATSISSTQVNLSWLDRSNNEVGFRIERKSGKKISTFTLPADATTFSDNTVASNTSYTYKILAYNAAGSSAYSNEISVKTQRISSRAK